MGERFRHSLLRMIKHEDWLGDACESNCKQKKKASAAEKTKKLRHPNKKLTTVMFKMGENHIT